MEFFPLEIDEIFEDGESVIRLFGRTTKGERVCVLDYKYEPYFLYKGKKEELDDLMITKDDITYFVTKVEDVNKKILGKEEKLLKVFVNNSKAIRVIAEELEDVYEYDIPFCKKYLIDKEVDLLKLHKIEGKEVKKVDYECKTFELEKIKQNSESFEKPNILAFDIETLDEVIFMISFYSKNFKKVVTWKKIKGNDIESVDGEEELLERFVEIIKEVKPDYLVSYYGDNFDFPFIFSRAKKYDVDLDLNVDGSRIRLSKNKVGLVGIQHLDLYKFIKKNMAVNLQTDVLDLGSVCKEIIGEEKKEMDFDVVFKDVDKNIKKICEYCLHDSKITYELGKNLFINLEELGKLTGMSLFDVCRASYGNLVENYLMKRSKEFNEVILSKKGYKRKREKYEGAFVMEPKPGFYENMVVFDFLSLYPSIIVTHNIGLGSLGKGKKVPGLKHKFDVKKKDFIPLVIEDLINRRKRIKEMMKDKNKVLDARNYALKTVANAMYGMFGFIGARWYCRDCGESITAYARDYIKNTIKEAEKEFEVIYSDTDSVAVVLGEKDDKDVSKFLIKINNKLPGLLELELEDFYKRGIFVSKKSGKGGAKKRYAMINEKNKIKIRGFEAVRRNSSEIAREVQRKVFDLVLKENNFEKALEYVKKIIKDVKKGKVDIKKMVIKTQITRGLDEYTSIGPHVAVARRMELKGLDVKPGTSIKYIIGKGKGLIREKAKLLEESEGYDEEYYINNQIIPVVEGIFEVFGVDKESLVKEQRKLGDF